MHFQFRIALYVGSTLKFILTLAPEMFKTRSAFLPSHPVSVKTALILSFLQHLNLPGGSFPSVFPPKQCIRFWVIKYTK